MSLNSKLITLSAIVTLSFGFSACSDDSSPSIPDDPECTADACAADGHTLNQCTDGKIVSQDCADSGKICSNGACVDSDEDPDDSKCTEDICLDETTLNKCYEGKFVKQDCSKSGKICSNNACVEKNEDPVEPECTVDACDADGITLLKCNDGAVEKIDCSQDNDQICSNNTCAPKGTEPSECTVDACDADGITLLKCNDGTIERIDCSQDNDQICVNNACAPKGTEPVECTADACDADGITLLKCNDGTIEKVDCSQDNDQICSNNACAPKGTEPVECTADACDADGVTLLKCNDGAIEKIDCSQDNDQICSNNACAPKTVEPPECDPNAEATCDGNTLVTCTPESKEKRINCESEKKICDPTAHECITPIEGSSVGMPCTCSGDSCDTMITGAELNPTMGSYAKFNNSDQIIVPNFFGNSSQISGCEALAAEIPEGMVLGCFRDSSLSANEGFISSAKDFMNTLKSNSWISSGVVNLANWGLKFIAKVEENIHLSVPNGYCFAGALDAHLVFSQSSGVINLALQNRGAKLVKLADEKFDTGDIEKAKTATCPEGSVLINDIHKTTTIAGYGQDGSDKTAFSMAMCLKSCESDSDCRTSEGYSCVEWHSKNVCFYKATIDAIHELETSLDIK